MTAPTQPDDAIKQTLAEITVRVGRGLLMVKAVRVAAKALECLIGLTFLASQFAVLAACGRYMEWW